MTAELMGNRVDRLYDVGVAGLHRLIKHVPKLQQANVVIVVAGMEGALPSVVAGLVRVPVIAVPTSIGYGASFHGLAALLGMPEQQIVHVRRGAALHDIGKMAIPDAVLRKPGPLSEDEWAVMRRHPQLGYAILRGVTFLIDWAPFLFLILSWQATAGPHSQGPAAVQPQSASKKMAGA